MQQGAKDQAAQTPALLVAGFAALGHAGLDGVYRPSAEEEEGGYPVWAHAVGGGEERQRAHGGVHPTPPAPLCPSCEG